LYVETRERLSPRSHLKETNFATFEEQEEEGEEDDDVASG
jgi:hypothetical protein